MLRHAIATLVLSLLATGAARAGDAEEATYRQALEWILGQQHANGGFGQIPGEEPGELGITGMTLQALANAPASLQEQVRPALAKGEAFLLRHQRPDGSFTQGRSGLTTYRTSVSILALAALDKARHQETIAKAAAWLRQEQYDEDDKVDRQSPHYGGFGYGGDGRGRGGADLSNTHLALQALHEAGIPQDDPVFQRALVFVARCQNNSETNDALAGLKPHDDGGFFYDPAPPRDSAFRAQDGTHSFPSYAGMTYAGLLSLVTCGAQPDSPAVQAALRWIAANYTLDENRGMGRRAAETRSLGGLYYYYNAFADCLSTLGRPTVETLGGPQRWAEDLFAALKARQRPDGSFVNSDPRWWEGDPVLVTTYCLNAMNRARPYLNGAK